MRHRAARSFWKCYESFPAHIQKSADEKYRLLKADPNHTSLQFKKVGKVWSVRISGDYRALAYYDGEDYIWFWAGTHNDYDKKI